MSRRTVVTSIAVVAIGVLVVGCTTTPSSSSALVQPSPSATSWSPSTAPLPIPSASPGTQPSMPPSPPPPPVDPTGPWHVAGSLAVERVWHAAVTLAAGDVLLMGGDRELYDAQGDSIPIEADTVELWDPVSETWHVTESLAKRRFEPALVALQDGRALVIGGHNEEDQSYSSSYAFDPSPETWSKVGLMSVARAAASAAVLDDGRVLVAGGYFREAPHYDEGALVGAGARMAAYRSGHSAGPAALAVGARTADIDPPDIGYAFATAELFDPATGSWSPTGSMRYARAGAAAVTLADGRVLVVGSGDLGGRVELDDRAFETAEIFDPDTGRFTLTKALPAIDRDAIMDAGVPLPGSDPQPAAVGSLVALDDGGALLVGHGAWWKHEAEVIRTLRFDPDGSTWQEARPAEAWVDQHTETGMYRTNGESRLWAFVTALPDGHTLVAGGQGAYQSAGGTTASAEFFDVRSGSWTDIEAMPEPRTDGVAVSLGDGSALLIGGHADSADGGWTYGLYTFRYLEGR